METKKIISKKKGFFELLLVTDGQGYMIDRYWERGGYSFFYYLYCQYCHIHRKPRCRLIASSKK